MVGDFGIVIDIDQVDSGTKQNTAGVSQSCNIDNLRVRQLVLKLLDSPLGKTLLFPRCVILGILLEITVLSRLCNRRNDSGPVDFFKALQLFSEGRLTSDCHWNFIHLPNSHGDPAACEPAHQALVPSTYKWLRPLLAL